MKILRLKKILLSALLLLSSCTNNNYPQLKQCGDNSEKYIEYQACDLEKPEDYYNVIIDNSKKSNNVILFLKGGPIQNFPISNELKTAINSKDKTNFKIWNEMSDQNKLFYNVIKESNASFLILNQIQYLKQSKFLNGDLKNFTYQDGVKEHSENVDIIHKVIKHLKNQGKTVLLAGNSYGSFLANSYLAKYGNSLPDFFLIAAGRLKMKNPHLIKLAYQRGYKNFNTHIYFKENDAIDFTQMEKMEKNFPDRKNLLSNQQKNRYTIYEKIGFVNLYKDYTKLIKSDLSNVTFLTSDFDSKVGWFNDEEINWAKSKGANIKSYSKMETLKNAYESGFEINTHGTIEKFAHTIPAWNKAMIKKYYLDPFVLSSN